MELLVENFRKIKSAKIKCNGITVIVGYNNTGKSTIGKILFSLYNSTANLQEKIIEKRKKEVESEILNLSDKDMELEIISKFFNGVFYQQLNDVVNSKAKITLKIKEKEMNLEFENDMCNKFSSEFDIINNAFYIDSPFIINELGKSYKYNIFVRKIIDTLNNSEKDIEQDIKEEMLIKINKILENVIGGDIFESQKGEYYFRSNKSNNKILVSNLSTGLKAFAIIKMFLEKGVLKEKDILILDNPENYLHPQWQLYYAELIVLLQEYFNLTIIITTNSPYFLEAIEVFSAKHRLSDKINYYLFEDDLKNGVKVKSVTNNIEEIFKGLANPMQQLENIRNNLLTE